MNAWAQGMIGGSQRTFDPSTRALGPNSYLGLRTFLIMMLLALALHLVLIVVFSLIKPPIVTDIPVRALSFKIGDNDRIAAVAAPVAVQPVAPASPAPVAATEWKAAVPKPKPQPLAEAKPVKQPKVVPITDPEERQTPVENRSVLPPLPTAQQPDTPPAIAQTPQRFIREVGAAPQVVPAGTPASVQGASDGAVAAIRARYEEQISSWIQLHKLYPMAAQGAEGRAVVRMRIDRFGYVRYYAIEQSSGNAVLDQAAIDMVRRANPVPAVPANYPSGTLIEFLIPISFKVPQ